MILVLSVYCIHMVNIGEWNLLSWAGRVGVQVFNLDSPAFLWEADRSNKKTHFFEVSAF